MKKIIVSKIKAAAVHLLVSIFFAAFAGFLVYFVWYPKPFADMLAGTNLYQLVVVVELVLGPAMSLVIFNPAKHRKELFRDYAIIGCVQLAALLYGLHATAISRPVYLVFVKDRIEVMVAAELDKKDLAEGGTPFSSLPLFGPKLICTESPTDPQEKSDLLMSALDGKDIQSMPKYYRECNDGEMIGRAFSVALLQESIPELEDLLDSNGVSPKEAKWLPVKTRLDTWTVFFSEADFSDAKYLKIDPFL